MENKDLRHPCTLISVIALVISLVSLSFSLSSGTQEGSVQGRNDIAPPLAEELEPVVEEEIVPPYMEVAFTVSPKVLITTAGPQSLTFHAAVPFNLVDTESVSLSQDGNPIIIDSFFADSRGELVMKVSSEYINTVELKEATFTLSGSLTDGTLLDGTATMLIK